MKKLIVLLSANALVATFGVSAYAKDLPMLPDPGPGPGPEPRPTAYATKQMPLTDVGYRSNGFKFRPANGMTGGINLNADWSCMDGSIIGALLGPEDDILNGWGPSTAGGQVVLGFDKYLNNGLGTDLIIYAIGPGWCIDPAHPGTIKPVKVYISDYNEDSIYPVSEQDEIFPVPWYFNENYDYSGFVSSSQCWVYVGTVMPSNPPCVGGGVVYATHINFDNIRDTDAVTFIDDQTPTTYGHFRDDGDPLDFSEMFPNGVKYVKIVFGDLTKWDDYPYSSDYGITCHQTGNPDYWPANLIPGDGHAKYIDAVEGLYPAPLE